VGMGRDSRDSRDSRGSSKGDRCIL
jgi:hypothetical protein